jgi:uncharacterized protein with NAD-binding domain and iron-sulfur cluster
LTGQRSDEDSANKRIRVAVLGGGCGALSAIWGLLQSPEADRYDITVYQKGWRLGGKGASGRNQAMHDRIEEHGLHIWAGCYENAFAMMRQVYEELDRPEGTPLSRWYDPEQPGHSAFLPHDMLTLMEFEDSWRPWNITMPTDDRLPGDGRGEVSTDSLVELVTGALIEAIVGSDALWRLENTRDRSGVAGFVEEVAEDLLSTPARLVARLVLDDLKQAGQHGRRYRKGRISHAEMTLRVLEPLDALRRKLSRELAPLLKNQTRLRRCFVLLDLGVAVITGILRDGLIERGWGAVDDEEFRAWLRRHGAGALSINSPIVRGWYDFFFAYEHGPSARPTLSAATALSTLWRYAFTYKGAFFWKMQAGMGDTVFAPLYETLKRRVNFRFFHRVDRIEVDAAAEQVSRVHIHQQVDLAPGNGPYRPLVDVQRLPCWPSAPLYAQLDPSQARLLEDNAVNLETCGADAEPANGELVLEQGADFDVLIVAIPPAELGRIAPELRTVSPAWERVLAQPAIGTMAAQLWLEPEPAALGWAHPGTVGTNFAHPMDTWANMDQLLAKENWEDAAVMPESLIYLCSTLRANAPDLPADQTESAARQLVRNELVAWMMSSFGSLWPDACIRGTPAIDWQLLVGDGADDADRIESQYYRANLAPSELYVLSPPGTDRARIRADETGLKNVYVAGDWLATGLNAGCVEAAVMGGLQASQAISGFPERIIGDDDIRRPG